MTQHDSETIGQAMAIYRKAFTGRAAQQKSVSEVLMEVTRGMPTCEEVARWTPVDPGCTCSICLTIGVIGRDLLRAGRFQELAGLANAIGTSRTPLPSVLLRDLPNRAPWSPR